MPITFVDRNGPPEGIICPTFICDICGKPIDKQSPAAGADEGKRVHGWVLWVPTYPDNDDRPTIECLLFVHGGECDRQAESSHQHHHYSRGLDMFLHNLNFNFEHPLGSIAADEELELGEKAEYVAPTPSDWRMTVEGRSE